MAESLALLVAVLAVGLGSVGFALRALWRPPTGRWGARLLATRDGVLAERKEAALVALRELDHDHRVGSLDEGDYRVLRAELAADAVRALQAEDAQLGTLDAVIEREVAEARAGRRAAVAAPPTPACRRCHRDAQPADRFCAGCGASLLRPLPAADAAGGASVPFRNGSAGPVSRAARGGPRPLLWLGAGGVLAAAVVAGTLWLTLSAPRRAAQQPLATLPVATVRALAVDPADPSRLFAAHDAGLLASADGGRTWQPVAAATGAVEGVVVPAGRGGTVYAAGRGLFLRSDDGGRTWEALGTRLPAPEARALAVDPVDPRILYTVLGGELYRSEDGGDTWTPAGTPPPGVTALAVVPAGPGFPRQLWAATAQDGVLDRLDGGAAWGNANGFVNGALPTRAILSLAYDPASGDRYEGPAGQGFAGAVYAGTDRGLFKSTDGGYSWFRLPLEVPAAAVAVAPGGGVVLVADPSGRLFRSLDRGLTWPGEAGP